MHCLSCHEVIMPETTWDNIFFLSKPSKLCNVCEQMLYILQGARCVRCSREHASRICPDCRRWDRFYAEEDPLTYNFSIYWYNAKIQEILAQWKYRGDYELGNVFKEQFRASFATNFPSDAVVIPIPLSKERLRERAFNQAQMLASMLPVEMNPILARVHSEKQSKKSRKERLNSINPFKLKKTIEKPAILVDDLYTTGITLRHAATLLKNNGCPNVYAYTLIRA